MAPRITYAGLPFGPNSFALWDQSLSDCNALSTVPCTCAGVNNLVLTPNPATFAFTLSAYTSFYGLFTFVASDSSTAPITANVNGLGSLNVYLSDGQIQAGQGSILAGGFYAMSYSAALNGGTGGFFLISTGASTTDFSLIGDVTASGTSPLTTTISPNIVTYDKLQQGQPAVILANPTGAAANYQEVTTGPTLLFNGTALQTAAFTGDVTSDPNSFGMTIATGAVTLSKLGQMPPKTVVGNAGATTTTPVALPQADLTSLVLPFTSTLSGAVPFSGGGIENYLRADGTWKPTTGGYVPLVTLSTITLVPDLRDTTHIIPQFEDYYIVFSNVVPVVQSSFIIELSQDGGTTWIATNYQSVPFDYINGAISGVPFSATAFLLANGSGAGAINTVNIGYSGTGTLTGAGATGFIKTYNGQGIAKNGGTNAPAGWGTSGYWVGNTNPINGVRFRYTSTDGAGNSINFGKIKIYGIVSL